MAESLGLEKIASCDQLRRLLVAKPELPSQFVVSADTGSEGVSVDAVLTFALYFGEAESAIRRMTELARGQ